MRKDCELCFGEIIAHGIYASSNELMKDNTSIGIGGAAEIFVKARNIEECLFIQKMSKKYNLPLHMLGHGSNLVVSDNGVKGIVMKFDKAFDSIVFAHETVFVQGNVGMGDLIARVTKIGLGGIESFAGIPASVLGLVAMNGGAFNVQMSSLVKSVVAQIDSEIAVIENKDCEFEYRKSRFINTNQIIYGVTLTLQKTENEKAVKEIERYISIRKKTQPIGAKTAGSVFKNPVGHYAGQLLEEVGLKGHTQNGVRFSEVHTNFIENIKDGKCVDVLKLIDIGRELVYSKYNIVMEKEIQILE